MIKLIAGVQGYLQSEEGATAIEYGLIAGGIALAIVGALFAFGDQLSNIFDIMETEMTDRAAEVQENTAD